MLKLPFAAILTLFLSQSALADERSQGILDGFAVTPEEIESLEAGEILSYSDREFELTERELAADAIIRVEAGMTEIVESLQDDPTLIPRDLVIASGIIESEADFREIAFGAADMEEVERFFNAKPGKTLNFNNAEYALLKERLAPYHNASAIEQVDAASSVLREIMLGRFTAYREKGINGVAVYDRSRRKQVDVGAELQLTTDSAKPFEDLFPEFINVMVAYPEGADCCEHVHRWVKVKIRKRPVFALSHTVVKPAEDAVLIMERVYFVTSQLNSLQITTVWVPYEGGGFLGLSTSASADVLDSTLGRMLRPVGRNKAKDIVVGVMEETKSDLESGPSED